MVPVMEASVVFFDVVCLDGSSGAEWIVRRGGRPLRGMEGRAQHSREWQRRGWRHRNRRLAPDLFSTPSFYM